MDSIISTKKVNIFPNNKPWITKEQKDILNKNKRIFFTNTKFEKKDVDRKVKHAMKNAKLRYNNKMENKFTQASLRSAWQGIKNMAAVNTASTTHRAIQESFSSRFHLDDQLTLWIIDFLTNRTQRVLANKAFSDLSFTSTGSPQGGVPSPLLFILYTHDCKSTLPDFVCAVV